MKHTVYIILITLFVSAYVFGIYDAAKEYFLETSANLLQSTAADAFLGIRG